MTNKCGAGSDDFEGNSAGVQPKITRRDFIGATLLGTGAALLDMPSPAAAQQLGRAWTGYGGVGDYRFSNGNTAGVVQSAHRVRDHAYGGANAIDTGESYDVVIVGGGFAGLGAMHEFNKRGTPGKCLLIDNQSIFGGFAKSNEFDVDGYRLAGPQASINFHRPRPDEPDEYWHELGLPDEFQYAKREGGNASILFPKATSSAVYLAEQCATIGYYFQNDLTKGKGVWVKNIWDDNLKRAPWPEALKQALITFRDSKKQYKEDKDEPAWLDSMTYGDFVTQVMGLSPEVLSYFTPIMGIVGQTPQVSAYGASIFPGVARFPGRSLYAGDDGERWVSFPGGNATLLRHFVKAIFPDAIHGQKIFEDIANNPVNISVLDRPGSICRMRLSATVVSVAHDGDPATAGYVTVTYEKGGRLYRVRAKGAFLAIGTSVAKHIVRDLPSEHRVAFDQCWYAPILMVNVALRNWRFLDKLGFSAARWFDGFGFYSTVRQPMMIGSRATPFHPDKPIVMTFYVPIQRPDLPLVEQGPAARMQLYGTSYAEYERQIVGQMQRMFGPGGFQADRDIAGIVLNRWGHAFLSPPPGFYFPKDGKPSPEAVVQKPFGRISFYPAGWNDWDIAAAEGKRAVTRILQTV